MCYTASGDFLVSLESKDEIKIKIARYSNLNIIQEIQYDQIGRPIYAAGKYYVLVEENTNPDICASDPNKKRNSCHKQNWKSSMAIPRKLANWKILYFFAQFYMFKQILSALGKGY